MLTRTLLLACSVAAVVCGALSWVVPLSPAESAPREPASARGLRPADPPPNIDSLVVLLTARAPFRADRRPAAVAYGTTVPHLPAVAPSTAPRPVLTLSGIVWGPQPVAVLEGFPGLDRAKVVRRGEVVGNLEIKRIERGRVWVLGPDTSWTLTVKEPWR